MRKSILFTMIVMAAIVATVPVASAEPPSNWHPLTALVPDAGPNDVCDDWSNQLTDEGFTNLCHGAAATTEDIELVPNPYFRCAMSGTVAADGSGNIGFYPINLSSNTSYCPFTACEVNPSILPDGGWYGGFMWAVDGSPGVYGASIPVCVEGSGVVLYDEWNFDVASHGNGEVVLDYVDNELDTLEGGDMVLNGFNLYD